MGDKSLQKKQYIINASRKVFIEKGFASVTMKDIVEGCDISRGGLYLYFDSVEGIFDELLKQELSRGSTDLGGGIIEALTNTDILRIYMREQKKEIMTPDDSIAVAIYEYCFKIKKDGTKTVTDSQLRSNVAFLEGLFKAGNESREFKVENPRHMAKNIAYAFEGLKVLSRSGTVTEKMIDDEVSYLLGYILA